MPETTSTRLSDLVVPEIFDGATREASIHANTFLNSGIAAVGDNVSIGEGKTINMPFYQFPTGSSDVWDDTQDLVPGKITDNKDVAVVLTRARAWGRSDLSAAIKGDDPADALASYVGEYWAHEYTECLIATLNGVAGAFSAESPDSNFLDISGLSGAASYIDGMSFIDATHRLGDRSSQVTAIAVHSATEAWLRKNNLIEDIMDSEGQLLVTTFQGRRVIIDDEMPVSGSGTDAVFTSFLFANGAVTWVDEDVEKANETDRDPLKNGGIEYLVTRRKFLMHPRGVAWTPASGDPALATPSNAELALAANWQRVWKSKNIRFVAFKHKIG